MAPKRVARILCAADCAGSSEAVEALLAAIDENDIQAVALIGDLSDGEGKPQSFGPMLQALASSEVPVFSVPGPSDAPVDVYLREAANIEVVSPRLRGVHGTAAFAPGGQVLFAAREERSATTPGSRARRQMGCSIRAGRPSTA